MATVPIGLISIGIFGYLITGLKFVPSNFQAVFGVLRDCLTVGLLLSIWVSLQQGDRKKIWLYSLAFLAIPTYYVLVEGFVSFGVQYMLIFYCFLMTRVPLFQSRAKFAGLYFLPIAYCFLSVFCVYMENRSDLRLVLWSDSDVQERVEAISQVASLVRPLNWNDDAQLYLIDYRLNQCIYVGKSIDYLELYSDRFANGDTLLIASLSWVPRFFWEDKPTTGSTKVLSEFTGMRFSESTAMQTGPIFEFYINFGWYGIVIGLFCYGLLIRWVDLIAAQAIEIGDFQKCTVFLLIGLVFAWPGTLLGSQLTAVFACLAIRGLLLRSASTMALILKRSADTSIAH
jgi:hypothetical protein